MAEHALVLFDGDCGLCNRAVSFILKRDRKGYFSFISLDNPLAKNLRDKYNFGSNTDFLILIERGKAFTASTAALKIASRLPFPWRSFKLFLWIPLSIRDWVYKQIAHRRIKWFGRQNCELMENEKYRGRFVGN